MIMLLFVTTMITQNRLSHNVDYSNTALEGYSPVSYLDLGLAQLGLKEHKATYNDIAYYFTSEGQKETFNKNPKKYMPQYGGFCSMGMFKGAKFRPDPTKFIVKDGKLFLFAYDAYLGDAKQFWFAGNDHDGYVKAADKNWMKLQSVY